MHWKTKTKRTGWKKKRQKEEQPALFPIENVLPSFETISRKLAEIKETIRKQKTD